MVSLIGELNQTSLSKPKYSWNANSRVQPIKIRCIWLPDFAGGQRLSMCVLERFLDFYNDLFSDFTEVLDALNLKIQLNFLNHQSAVEVCRSPARRRSMGVI